jgi:hypothetical protein
MNETRTSSMLQRLPVILAVTAASYGLQVPAYAARLSGAIGTQSRTALQLPGGTRPAASVSPKQRG